MKDTQAIEMYVDSLIVAYLVIVLLMSNSSALFEAESQDPPSSIKSDKLPNGLTSSPQNIDDFFDKVNGILYFGKDIVPCLYHLQALGYVEVNTVRMPSPMERFLGEGNFEQDAVFVREDTGHLSISKPCTCAERIMEEKGV
jgi:hypothetical protein